MIISYLDQIKKRAEKNNLTLRQVRVESGIDRVVMWQYTTGRQNMGYVNTMKLDTAIDRLIINSQAA